MGDAGFYRTVLFPEPSYLCRMYPPYHHLLSLLTPRYGQGEARAIAMLVLERLFGFSRTMIYAGTARELTTDEAQHLAEVERRLSQGEPVQYVLGEASFLGRDFAVTPAVLIPRPETEELVGYVIEAVQKQDGPLMILDGGTGSGCIAVSLALALPVAEVTAWDLSPEALAVAKGNARRHGAKVHFAQRDLLDSVAWEGTSWDVIVSNPPYIREAERAEMAPHVTHYEPGSALFVPDDDPLRFYRALAEAAVGGALRSGGLLAVEGHRDYIAAVADLFARHGLTEVRALRDAFGNLRFVMARAGERHGCSSPRR